MKDGFLLFDSVDSKLNNSCEKNLVVSPYGSVGYVRVSIRSNCAPIMVKIIMVFFFKLLLVNFFNSIFHFSFVFTIFLQDSFLP